MWHMTVAIDRTAGAARCNRSFSSMQWTSLRRARPRSGLLRGADGDVIERLPADVSCGPLTRRTDARRGQRMPSRRCGSSAAVRPSGGRSRSQRCRAADRASLQQRSPVHGTTDSAGATLRRSRRTAYRPRSLTRARARADWHGRAAGVARRQPAGHRRRCRPPNRCCTTSSTAASRVRTSLTELHAGAIGTSAPHHLQTGAKLEAIEGRAKRLATVVAGAVAVAAIGSFVPAAPVVLAPMAGVTNAPFRALCRRFGPGLVYVNEMVMATAVVHGNAKTDADDDVRTRRAPAQPADLRLATR